MAVKETDRWIGGDLIGKDARKIRDVDQLPFGTIDQIVGDLDFSLEDHAEKAVAPDNVTVEIGIFGPAGDSDGPVGQHDPQAAKRAFDGPHLMVHAVGVDRDRSADGKDVGRLHGLHGKARMQGILDIVPARAALYRHGAGGFIDGDRVEPRHVEDDAIRRKGVAAHGMPRPGHRNFQAVRACIGQGIGNVLFGLHCDNALNRGAGKAAHIIHGTGAQRPWQAVILRQARQRLLRDDGAAILGLHRRRSEDIGLMSGPGRGCGKPDRTDGLSTREPIRHE